MAGASAPAVFFGARLDGSSPGGAKPVQEHRPFFGGLVLQRLRRAERLSGSSGGFRYIQ